MSVTEQCQADGRSAALKKKKIMHTIGQLHINKYVMFD